MISICIPYIRDEGFDRCVEALKRNNGDIEYEIISEKDVNRIGCPLMLKKLVNNAKYSYIMFLADDVVPQKDMLINAVGKMYEFEDEWGLVGLNDGFISGDKHATHWVAHKKLLEHLDGEFFHTGYKHCYCDNELALRVQQINRYKYAENARLIHMHPIVQKDNSLTDKDYMRVYSQQYLYHDEQLFLKRKNNNWK